MHLKCWKWKENHQATFNSTTVTCKLNKCLDVSYVKILTLIKTKIDTNIQYNTKPQFSKKRESKKNKLSQNFALINLYWIGNKLSWPVTGSSDQCYDRLVLVCAVGTAKKFGSLKLCLLDSVITKLEKKSCVVTGKSMCWRKLCFMYKWEHKKGENYFNCA